jgi:uncharacterized membrane protein YfcA
MTLSEFILVFGSFVISIFNASIGPTGGMSLAMIASLLPPAAVIPIHGAVESAASGFRTVTSLKHIEWRIPLIFGAGSITGGLFGASISLNLPHDALQIVIALFILYGVWGPKPAIDGKGPWRLPLLGLICGFASMLGAAVGALIIAYVGRAVPDRRGVIATQSACVTFIHAFKMIAFGLLGFAFAPYADLIAMMIAATLVGSIVGRLVLDRMNEALFRKLFRIVVTVLAIRMILKGIGIEVI